MLLTQLILLDILSAVFVTTNLSRAALPLFRPPVYPHHSNIVVWIRAVAVVF